MPPPREDELMAVMQRIHGADDPWAELMAWVEERRKLNAARGGDERLMITYLVIHTFNMTIPFLNSRGTK